MDSLELAIIQLDKKTGCENQQQYVECGRCGGKIEADLADFYICDSCQKLIDIEISEFLDTYEEEARRYIYDKIQSFET